MTASTAGMVCPAENIPFQPLSVWRPAQPLYGHLLTSVLVGRLLMADEWLLTAGDVVGDRAEMKATRPEPCKPVSVQWDRCGRRRLQVPGARRGLARRYQSCWAQTDGLPGRGWLRGLTRDGQSTCWLASDHWHRVAAFGVAGQELKQVWRASIGWLECQTGGACAQRRSWEWTR